MAFGILVFACLLVVSASHPTAHPYNGYQEGYGSTSPVVVIQPVREYVDYSYIRPTGSGPQMSQDYQTEPHVRVETNYDGYPQKHDEGWQYHFDAPVAQSPGVAVGIQGHGHHENGGHHQYLDSGYGSAPLNYQQHAQNERKFHEYAAHQNEEKIYVMKKHHDNQYDQNALKLIETLRRKLVENRGKLSYYDADDVTNLLEGPNSLVMRYLNQRELDVEKAASLAESVLSWRASLNLNKMHVSQILCDLYSRGLIFQQNVNTENPIVWIRLGQLSNIMSKLHTTKIPSLRTKTLKNLAKGSLKVTGEQATTGNELVKIILSAIAWWLDDWDRRNLDSKTILVLDFENTKNIFSNSISVTEFFMKLDDKFPDLFKKIVHFRSETGCILSVDKQLSKLNRVVQSQVASRVTSAKTLSANRVDELVPLIGTGHLKGESQVPDHVLGQCASKLYHVPRECSVMQQRQLHIHEHEILNTIANSFTSSCTLKKPHKSIRKYRSHHL